MQNQLQEYMPCPKCGKTDAKKVTFTWWGGALGPALFKQVKCNNCGTEYNSQTGESNQQKILLYILGSFVIAFCVCGGIGFLSTFLNSN